MGFVGRSGTDRGVIDNSGRRWVCCVRVWDRKEDKSEKNLGDLAAAWGRSEGIKVWA